MSPAGIEGARAAFSRELRNAFNSWWRVLRWLLALGVGVGFVLVVPVRLLYPRLLYPAPQRDLNAPAGGKMLTLRARDGVPVHAMELDVHSSGPVLVYFHGNGVVMGDVAWMAREFARRGLGVVVCEYRGYGLSSGHSPSEAGLYEDAEAVLEALKRRGIGPDRVVLFGESLGTGVASEMALRGRGSGLVLVTPYTSIPEAAARFVFGVPLTFVMRERFDTLAKARDIGVPALILHGTDDEVIPQAHGARIAATLRHARFMSVQGGHHNDLFLGEGARYFDDVAAFAHQVATKR